MFRLSLLPLLFWGSSTIADDAPQLLDPLGLDQVGALDDTDGAGRR